MTCRFPRFSGSSKHSVERWRSSPVSQSRRFAYANLNPPVHLSAAPGRDQPGRLVHHFVHSYRLKKQSLSHDRPDYKTSRISAGHSTHCTDAGNPKCNSASFSASHRKKKTSHHYFCHNSTSHPGVTPVCGGMASSSRTNAPTKRDKMEAQHLLSAPQRLRVKISINISAATIERYTLTPLQKNRPIYTPPRTPLYSPTRIFWR